MRGKQRRVRMYLGFYAKLLGLLALIVIGFGGIAPFLISAKSDLGVAGGFVFLLVVLVPACIGMAFWIWNDPAITKLKETLQ